MSKPQDRIIYQKENGKWANKRNDASKASSIHRTQNEAYKAAKKMSENQGGGEVSIKGRNQRIREKNTIKPGNDPRKIKG